MFLYINKFFRGFCKSNFLMYKVDKMSTYFPFKSSFFEDNPFST